jgi:predicted  nucleic acid-binding Zn-ribbon protein
LRYCKKCNVVVPVGDVCQACGSKKFEYRDAEKEYLQEEIIKVFNPYDVSEDVPSDATIENVQVSKDKQVTVGKSVFAAVGTEIPVYKLTQLPFVPRPAVTKVDSLYGISQVRMLLEQQDGANKTLSKAIDKTLKSGAVITKPDKIKLNDKDETFKVLSVRSYEESQQVQTKQIVADTSQDLAIAAMLYDSAKSSSGITDSFQGKRDTTATSGIAKQYQVAQSAGRIESLRVMKTAAYAGVYELVLKFLLAFSDRKRVFVKALPDGTEEQEEWSKYMFLDKDSSGAIYYRDDFEFNSDPAATLSEDRQAMWSETVNNFVQGTFGNPADGRTLTLFWNIMAQHGYPLAPIVLAGIKENNKHIPAEIEQAILANPKLMEMIQSVLTQGQGAGGARPNSGPEGNGATHAANVERTNARNAIANEQGKELVTSAQMAQTAGGV